MSTIRFNRSIPLPASPTGHCRAGAAHVDVTPCWDLAMAGYSTEGKRAYGYRGRLWVRALYLEDARGHRVAIAVADLHAASRYLLERTALETAPSCGISVDRLVLAGTHTHTAPGNFYGNTLFDSTTQGAMGFDCGYADWLASRIAGAIKAAAARARPATLGVGITRLWEVSRNRSLTPFRANNDSSLWETGGWPGAGAPQHLSSEARAVDPRVTAIAAFDAGDGEPIGALGLFGCHNTAIGPEGNLLDADWCGRASTRARSGIAVEGSGPVVAVALSAAGDVTANTDLVGGRGVELARTLGDRVGDALAEAIGKAAGVAEAFDLDVFFDVPEIGGTQVGDRTNTRLADDWDYGAPTLGGSEESRTIFHALGLVREGMPGDEFPETHPQHPKLRALGVLQEAVGFLIGLEPSKRWPLHVVRLGRHMLATVPGEATSMSAFRIERALLELDGVDGANVLSYAGDYAGYFATEEEYHHQHYEGSSTLFGRNSARHVRARLVALASAGAATPPSGGQVVFDVGARIRAFTEEVQGPMLGPIRPAVSRKGARIEVRWRMPASVRLTFADSFFVLLTEQVDGEWRPVRRGGRDYDDRSQEMVVQEFRPAFDPFPGIHGWGIDLWLPEDLDPTHPLRIEVAPRGPFPGFRADVPE